MKQLFTCVLLLSGIIVFGQTKTIVYFNSSKSDLLPAARHTLDSLILVLKKSGQYHMMVNGYCDSTGRHPGNVSLADERANRVFNYLKAHGISSDSMYTNGFAEADPVADGKDEISKARNRRVEIWVRLPKRNGGQFDASTSIADLEVGQKMVIPNLNFQNNSAVLLTESISSIKILLKYMQDNPTLEIKLSGHVCCTNDLALSVERAQFVYNYLVRNGIDKSRMSYAGYSNSMPLAPHDDIDQAAAKVNRRVEITVIKK